jgi:hypothetical protein
MRLEGKGGERAVTETERKGEEERIVTKHQENSKEKRQLNIQAERDR